MSRRQLRRVCVFCGSSPGAAGPAGPHAQAAKALGAAMAARGISLVYGGGQVGLMGILADAVLLAGGHAVGVIPRPLARLEVSHSGLDELHLVATMHERKALMVELSDGFLALPGAYGTLDELCEVLTWQQLGIHAKPIALMDVAGYFADFLRFLDHAAREGFLSAQSRRQLHVASGPDEALDLLASVPVAEVPRWLTVDEG